MGGGSAKATIMGDFVVRWIYMFLVLAAAAAAAESEAAAVNDRPAVRLNVAAFNIQKFGNKKMANTEVVDCLKKILSKYDIVFIQEIVDQTNASIVALLNAVNSVGTDSWLMRLSTTLGRTASKEQYAYFYKTSTVSVVDEYQWPNTSDVYERPPFIIRIKDTDTNAEFGFIGVHVKPSDAVNEISNLTGVYDQISAKWAIQDFVIGGDFNAGGDYVKKSDWPRIRLRNDTRFQWVIDDNTDSTTGTSRHAYDRFVLVGSKMRSSFYVNGTARVYKYESDLCPNLPNFTAQNVSDHYPIEMQLLLNEATCIVCFNGNVLMFVAVVMAAAISRRITSSSDTLGLCTYALDKNHSF